MKGKKIMYGLVGLFLMVGLVVSYNGMIKANKIYSDDVISTDIHGTTLYEGGTSLASKYTEISDFPTCSGTDKLTYDGSTFSCQADVDTNTDTYFWQDSGGYLVPNASASKQINVSKVRIYNNEITSNSGLTIYPRGNTAKWVKISSDSDSVANPLIFESNDYLHFHSPVLPSTYQATVRFTDNVSTWYSGSTKRGYIEWSKYSGSANNYTRISINGYKLLSCVGGWDGQMRLIVDDVSQQARIESDDNALMFKTTKSSSGSYPAILFSIHGGHVGGEIRPDTNNAYDFGTDSYAWRNVYSYAYVDKSPFYNTTELKSRYGKTATELIKNIKSNGNGEIRHDTLPDIVGKKIDVYVFKYNGREIERDEMSRVSNINQKKKQIVDKINNELRERLDVNNNQISVKLATINDIQVEAKEDGRRDLGSMISLNTAGIQELVDEINYLKSELCKKDSTYKFCVGGMQQK